MRAAQQTGRRGWRVAALLTGLVGVLVLAGCQSGSTSSASGAATSARSAGSSSSAAAAPSTPDGPRKGSGTAVHISLFEGDGTTYGVAMPVIAYFSQKVTDASVFDAQTKVTVNGQPATGAWYWEPSSRSDYAMEAHYRLQDYWPAHADVHVELPVKGLWAGQGLVFDNDVTLDMKTGAAQVAQVDGQAETMVLTSDGQPVKTLKVSLGAAKTPTYLGTAVTMAKSNPEEMKSDPGETPAYDLEVPWSVRVTYSGEFIHDAYWNGHLGQENLSHGCTNLSPADAEWYYNWSQIGDPVTWTNTGTSTVIPVADGWGDWNLDWATYQKGGALAPAA